MAAHAPVAITTSVLDEKTGPSTAAEIQGHWQKIDQPRAAPHQPLVNDNKTARAFTEWAGATSSSSYDEPLSDPDLSGLFAQHFPSQAPSHSPIQPATAFEWDLTSSYLEALLGATHRFEVTGSNESCIASGKAATSPVQRNSPSLSRLRLHHPHDPLECAKSFTSQSLQAPSSTDQQASTKTQWPASQSHSSHQQDSGNFTASQRSPMEVHGPMVPIQVQQDMESFSSKQQALSEKESTPEMTAWLPFMASEPSLVHVLGSSARDHNHNQLKKKRQAYASVSPAKRPKTIEQAIRSEGMSSSSNKLLDPAVSSNSAGESASRGVWELSYGSRTNAQMSTNQVEYGTSWSLTSASPSQQDGTPSATVLDPQRRPLPDTAKNQNRVLNCGNSEPSVLPQELWWPSLGPLQDYPDLADHSSIRAVTAGEMARAVPAVDTTHSDAARVDCETESAHSNMMRGKQQEQTDTPLCPFGLEQQLEALDLPASFFDGLCT